MATLVFLRYHVAVNDGAGLRERKKRQTRQTIAETAWGLFVERGFDGVSVAEIALAADVSEATVFNYFATKEDLAYARMHDYQTDVLSAIRDRESGVSVVDAFGRYVLEPRGFLTPGEHVTTDSAQTITRVFVDSPALIARERAMFDRYAQGLAEFVADERGTAVSDIETQVIARALVDLHRALLDHVRDQVLAGVGTKRIAKEIRDRGERALSLLKLGIDPT